MHVAILTYGSRGDVQPFVALGAALRARGHTAMLAAPARFAALADAHGLGFTPLPGDIEQLSRALVDRGGGSPLAQVRALLAHALPIAVEGVARMREAVAGADRVVHTFATTVAGHQLAVERGVPDISAQLFPFFVPYAGFPNVAMPPGGRWPALNRASHEVATQMYRWSSRLSYGWLRRRHPALGPPRMRWPAPGIRTPLLLAYSPLLAGPTPAGLGRAQATGFWALDPGPYAPPPALAAFLENGPPPVFVGFGSMVSHETPRLFAAVLEALRRTGRRALIQRGWGGFAATELPPWALAIDEAPHEWLFPRTAAVIHHGGAGTTGAALRSGVPSLAVPFTADQPFWGWRAHRLGVGPPIPARQLTADGLAAALGAINDPAVRRRAAAVGAALRAEGGLEVAVQAITGGR